MKKIININLSGRVIPIEDSAYEKLQGYIESLRRFFSKEEGRDEIINDIESRIAELMNEKVRKGADAITDADIEEIMQSMGRPEDFEPDMIDTGATMYDNQGSTESAYTEPKRLKGRLYRDSSDKILGGVCSGIASYLNVDPAIIRLLFAIITFGGFGFGVLLYILLWIFLPSRDLEEYGGKRLYRNPEDRILGGVASGLAAYFNREAWTIRIIFLAPFLLNMLVSVFSWSAFHDGGFFPNIVFGSLTGTFFLAYIILWIVLPEAKSEYQKMEMRGEKVDVNSIRQNVKGRAKEFGEEVRTAAQNISGKAQEFAKTRGRTFATEASEAARRTGSGLGRVIGLIFKVFFLFIAGSIAFALFIGLMALIFGGVGIWPLKNYVLEGVWQNIFAWGTLLLFLGIPLVAFITWILRRIMGVKRDGYLGWIFGGLWILGWISMSFFVASLIRDFRRTEKEETTLSIAQPLNGKMIVNISEPEIRYSGTYWWFDADDAGWDVTEDTLRMANVKVRIEKSIDSNYHVTVSRYSAGRDINDALSRARNIKFNTYYTDSILHLGSGLAITQEDKFRFQRVLVNIQVPVGKKIRFDESMDKLHPFNIRMYERRRWNGRDWDMDWDWDNYFDWETNIDYVMNERGELVNPNKPVTQPEEYRYQAPTPREVEEQRRKVEEEQRRLREMEQKTKEEKDTIKLSKKESMDDTEDENPVVLNSPVFSLVKGFL